MYPVTWTCQQLQCILGLALGSMGNVFLNYLNQTCFLAHLSRRLEWAIAVRFRPSSVVRRPSCVVRRASSVVRRPSSVNFLHFHLLLENAWLDFNQTWQESSLGVGDSKLFKYYVWPPWGPRGRAPKGQNHANFKHLLLQIQKENSQVM